MWWLRSRMMGPLGMFVEENIGQWGDVWDPIVPYIWHFVEDWMLKKIFASEYFLFWSLHYELLHAYSQLYPMVSFSALCCGGVGWRVSGPTPTECLGECYSTFVVEGNQSWNIWHDVGQVSLRWVTLCRPEWNLFEFGRCRPIAMTIGVYDSFLWKWLFDFLDPFVSLTGGE